MLGKAPRFGTACETQCTHGQSMMCSACAAHMWVHAVHVHMIRSARARCTVHACETQSVVLFFMVYAQYAWIYGFFMWQMRFRGLLESIFDPNSVPMVYKIGQKGQKPCMTTKSLLWYFLRAFWMDLSF